jgi:pimeloyl-ACP methyl ester carboxylesterase
MLFRQVVTAIVLVVMLLAPSARAASPPSTTKPAYPFKVKITGHGTPMILIPGLGCSGDVWEETVAHFQDRYECHVLTLPGFAGRKPIDPPILSSDRDAILRYIHDKKLAKPVIVGHSVGGFLAFSVASTDPDAVGPIVAVDGVPYLPALMDPNATPDTMRARADQMRQRMKSLSPQQMQLQNGLTLTRMVSKMEDLKRIQTWLDASDPNTIAEVMYEAFTTDLREPVAKIKSPVLLIAAGADAKDPPHRKDLEESYRKQVSAIPNVQVIVAEKAKHFIMMDDAEFLLHQIETFLQQAPKP